MSSAEGRSENSARSTFPEVVRDALGPRGTVQMIAALSLAGLGLVVVVGGQWPAGLSALDRGGSALSFADVRAPEWKTLMRTLGLAAWAGGALLLARWSPLRSSFGTRLPHGSHPWAMLVRLSTLYVMATLLSQYVLAAVTSSSGSSVSTAYAGYSPVERLVSSVWASTWEETFDVAVPIAFACFIWWAIRSLRAPVGTLVGPPTRVPAWCLTAAAIGLVTRWFDHLYQGVDSAVAVVAVGVVAVGLFAWGGSVLPLIVGHFVYDVVVASRPVLPSGELPGAALNWVALAVVLALTWVPWLRGQRSAPGRERVDRGR